MKNHQYLSFILSVFCNSVCYVHYSADCYWLIARCCHRCGRLSGSCSFVSHPQPFEASDLLLGLNFSKVLSSLVTLNKVTAGQLKMCSVCVWECHYGRGSSHEADLYFPALAQISVWAAIRCAPDTLQPTASSRSSRCPLRLHWPDPPSCCRTSFAAW